MKKDIGRPFNEDELIAQLGKMTFFAICGGKFAIWQPEGETVEADFWCGNGYRVRITLGWDDTWTVQRIFVRKDQVSIKGEMKGVYADQVSDIAYKASCYRSYEFGDKVKAQALKVKAKDLINVLSPVGARGYPFI